MTVIPFLLGPIFAGALIDNVNLNVWIFSKAGSLSHVARFSPFEFNSDQPPGSGGRALPAGGLCQVTRASVGLVSLQTDGLDVRWKIKYELRSC